MNKIERAEQINKKINGNLVNGQLYLTANGILCGRT